MRNKTVVVIGVAIITALVAGTAFGWGGCGKEGRGDPHRKGKMEAMAKELKLTPEQEKQLESAKEAHRAQMKEACLALKEKHEALRTELSKPGVTRQAVEPLVAQIKGLESAMIEQRVNGIFEVKSILTPKQFEKLQAKKGPRGKAGKMRHCGKEKKNFLPS